jgi:hypothetical protein
MVTHVLHEHTVNRVEDGRLIMRTGKNAAGTNVVQHS